MAESTSRPQYFIDSDVLLRHFRQQAPTVLHAAFRNLGRPLASIVVMHEVDSGGLLAGRESDYQTFFSEIRLVMISPKVATQAARIYADLRPVNQMIGLADIFIAATALAYQLPLLTFNINHFSRVNGLQLLPIPQR